jgi:tetratricopeptide (TPR) repeat protein
MVVDPEILKRQTEINRLMSAANVHRMRGEYVEAEDLCRAALALDESCVSVRELLADMLYARGQLEKAAEEYKKVTEALPGHRSAETKYAKVMLEMGENDYERRMAEEMLRNPHKFAAPKHPLVAAALSACVPGAGQLYNHENLKGAILIGTLFFSMLMLAMSPDTKNVFTAFKMLINPLPNQMVPPIGPMVYLFGFILVFAYVYAVIDAPITAGKMKGPEPKATTTGPKLEPPSSDDPTSGSPVPAPVPDPPKAKEPGNEESITEETQIES